MGWAVGWKVVGVRRIVIECGLVGGWRWVDFVKRLSISCILLQWPGTSRLRAIYSEIALIIACGESRIPASPCPVSHSGVDMQ